MKSKRNFWIYGIMAIVIVIGGILVYIFLKGKSQPPTNAGESGTVGEMPSGEENIGIIDKIKNFFGGGRSSGGGSSEGGGGGGGWSSAGGGSPSGGGSSVPVTSDQTICQNAQNDNLCNGLDLIYGDGYRTLCCSEHSLCC